MRKVRRWELKVNEFWETELVLDPKGNYVLMEDYARLKAEVERSRDQYNGIIDTQLKVIEGKQDVIDKLHIEVERLRKAGDAMAKRTEFFQKRWDADELCQEVEAWNAAKEGKPSV